MSKFFHAPTIRKIYALAHLKFNLCKTLKIRVICAICGSKFHL